jgi:glycerol uptake facilitator-like aquaporin
MTFAVNERGLRDWAGLGIGMALGLAVMVFAPLDGAGFNPARSFGPAIVSGEFADFWVYVIGPVIGAVLAAFGYVYLVLKPQERLTKAPIETLPG